MAFNITSNVLSMLNTMANMKTAKETKLRNEQAKTQADTAEATARELSNLQTNQLQTIAGNTELPAMESADRLRTKLAEGMAEDARNMEIAIEGKDAVEAKEKFIKENFEEPFKKQFEQGVKPRLEWAEDNLMDAQRSETDRNGLDKAISLVDWRKQELAKRERDRDEMLKANGEAWVQLDTKLNNILKQNQSTKAFYDRLFAEKRQGGNK